MLGEADELGHGTEVLIEIVELIRAGTRTCGESGESVERTVNAAIVREIHQVYPGRRDRMRQRMLIRMHVRRRRQRVAAIDVCKIYKGHTGACGVAGVDRAFIEIDRAGV